MKKSLLGFICVLFITCFAGGYVYAEKAHPDSVKTGIYVTSIHNIDFKNNEYTINFWLWLKYKKREFDFAQNLEIPQAKSYNKLYTSLDSSKDGYYLLLQLQCVMKDSWRINNFPFDEQKLRLSFENSQYDSKDMVFVPDTLGKHYDPRFTLRGWDIDSFVVSTNIKKYETNFGDPTEPKPHMEYSAYRVRISMDRDATSLFWKIFLGMYVAFCISYICFYIHADNIDSRFGLSVGSLFAAIGNKYIIDSSLPESTTFTLVDTLHGITLLSIFIVVACSVYSLKLMKKNKLKEANRFDMLAAQVLLVLYVGVNVYFIYSAQAHH